MRTFVEQVLEGRFVSDSFTCGDAALSKQQTNEIAALIKSDLAKARVISAENVAEYMYAISDKENWRADDCGCLQPPLMFVEFRQLGVGHERMRSSYLW